MIATGVRKSYGDVVALRDAALEVREGEILALLGPNGSGKTTLVKILATLIGKDAGKVEIMGYDLDRDEAAIRGVIGYVGQDADHSAYARLTIRENLEFFGALRGLARREISSRIHELAQQFESEDLLDRLFMTLSGGQKQTAIIMRALLSDPPLLFLDEPTRGLDPLVARRIRGFLRHYVTNNRRSVLLTSHILPEVEELADRVALIYKGSIGITGTAAELKQSLGIQGVLEAPAAISPAAAEEIVRTGGATAFQQNDPLWIRFGVPDGAGALDRLVEILRRHGEQSNFRYRPVTLEDAFLHHIGALSEEFDS